MQIINVRVIVLVSMGQYSMKKHMSKIRWLTRDARCSLIDQSVFFILSSKEIVLHLRRKYLREKHYLGSMKEKSPEISCS